MITKFIILFNKIIKNRFLNKILLTNLTIVIVVMFVLSLVISKNIEAILLEKETNYNRLILQNIHEYFNFKVNMVKKISQQAYLDNFTSPEVLGFLESEADPSDPEYISQKKKFDSYFRSAFSRDNDIVNIIIYKNQDQTYHIYSKNFERTYSKSEFHYEERISQLNKPASILSIFPVFKPDYYHEKDDSLYSMSLNIKKMWSNSNIGLLIIDFNPQGIDRALKQYDPNLSGDTLILSNNGEVIYDSSRQYYFKEYPYFENIKNQKHSVFINNNKSILSISTDKNTGVHIVRTIPEKVIFKQINATKHTIFFLALSCIILVTLMIYASMKFFSKKLRTLIGFINTVKNGNLSANFPIMEANDEISEIGLYLDKMCGDLNKYINRVYISEIKQKKAEITALQAQVNPHFLYNTLENIRMQAVVNDDTDVANMVFSLSRLLRNSIKEDSIITVSDEINNCKLYLNLYKSKYKDNLTVEFDIQPDIMDYGIMKHLVQPLIENYIVHGIIPKKPDNCINIKGYKEKSSIFFELSDNGKGIKPEKLQSILCSLENPDSRSDNIGILNVHERIKMVYGEHNGIVGIYSELGKKTIITVKIAAKYKQELMENV